MRRTIVSLQHKASWWDLQVLTSDSWSAEQKEGALAYAASQASVFCNLAKHFETCWSQPPSQQDALPQDEDEEAGDVGAADAEDESPDEAEDEYFITEA